MFLGGWPTLAAQQQGWKSIFGEAVPPVAGGLRLRCQASAWLHRTAPHRTALDKGVRRRATTGRVGLCCVLLRDGPA